MTPHPSQWGQRRRKECHPEPPPHQNVKKVALGKPQSGQGEPYDKACGAGDPGPGVWEWCESMGQGHPAGRLVKAGPPPPWRPPWERRLSRSGGECWGGGEEEEEAG